MFGRSKMTSQTEQTKKCFSTKETGAWIKILPRVSDNRPWATGPRRLVLVRPSSWGREGGYVNQLCEYQNPSFRVWMRKPYPCRYFRIVYRIVHVVVVVLNHFYVSFCRHFICLSPLLSEFYRNMPTVVSRPLVAQKRSLQWSFRAQLFEGRLALNPGLNFNPGLFFFSSKAFSCTIFSLLFRVANHQIVNKKN